jgi:hypothetical protein
MKISFRVIEQQDKTNKMPIPERLNLDQLKQKTLSHTHYDLLKRIGMASFLEKHIDELMKESYIQGTMCQNAAHGNRVGHFEEFVGTKTKES